MDLADVALFRAIAASGSLAAAGRQMGLAPMAVSRRLAGLEAEIGARLIHRTTRSLSLTAEGEAFLPHAHALAEAQEAALASVAPGTVGLGGTLKLTAPNRIGRSILVPILAEMIDANPSLRVELSLSDGLVDIAGAGLDLAIRVSPLESSELIAARLADNPRILCAAPRYLERFGAPERLDDLVSHACLGLRAMDSWPFHVGGERRGVRVSGPFSADSVEAVLAACQQGLGIALISYWDIWQSLERGELVRIPLADAEPDELGIWAVFPTRRHMPRRVRALIDAVKARLSQMPAAGAAGI